MPKRSGKERDFAVNAFRVVEQAIGEHMDGTALEIPKEASGKARSGKAGGSARAKSLTGVQKREIAVKAARARWAIRSGGSKNSPQSDDLPVHAESHKVP